MAVRGRGALAGWFDYRGEADMNEWQAREHILERVAVPGFLRGRRFESAGSEPEYFMFYETDDVAVFSSAPYLERLNTPTDWSRRCAPGLRNMTRSLCRVAATVGEIDGGHVATLEFRPAPGSEVRLRDWVAEELLGRLVDEPGVYAGHALEPDDAVSRIETTEKQIRTAPDRVSDWLLVVEGRDRASLEAGVAAPARAAALREHGAADVAGWRFYQLSFAAQR